MMTLFNSMRGYSLIILAIIATSCNSQTDIEQFEYGTDISAILENVKEVKKDRDATTSLVSYSFKLLDDFRYGNVALSTYKIPNGYPSDYNRIDFLVEDEKYVGISLHLVQESEGKKIFDHITSMYGNPSRKFEDEANESGYYLWNNPAKNSLVFLRHNQSNSRDKGATFYDTHVSIVQKGISVKPDPSNDTAKIQAILKENPNAFSLLEVFKSVFPNQ